MIELKELFKGNALFILHVIIEMLSSHLKDIKSTHYGHAKTCVKLSLFFWLIFIQDLALSYTDYCGYSDGLLNAEVIAVLNSTSRYSDALPNIDNTYFDGMVNPIYQSELQLNKANSSDTEALALFLDLHLTISDGFVSSKIYDKRDDFDFDIVNFPFLCGDIHRAPSYGL